MIFITVGSQKFQFNRLLKEIDRLIEENKITEEIFAQIGYSDYNPKSYKYKDFLDRDEFSNIMSKCDKVITHGGTGAIIGAMKHRKKVIAVPRLKKFGEHVDDHQVQIISEFERLNFIEAIYDINDLKSVINNVENKNMEKYISNTDIFIKDIEEFITSQKEKRWKK